MPLIPLLGPSRAGKTTVSRRLVEAPVSYDLDSLRLLDTDEELGPSHRSNAQRAIALLQRNNTEDEVVLADCGAGLIAFNEGFRQFLTAHPDYPRNLIVLTVGHFSCGATSRPSDHAVPRKPSRQSS